MLATKVYAGMDGITPNHSGLSRLQIVEGVKASLARLDLDWIDLLWFHGFDDRTPIEESLEAVEDLVSQGVVRYFGVSNFSVQQLESYLEAASNLSRRCRPIAVQNELNPLTGDDHGVLDLCVAEGIGFVPFSPLGRGLLTDRYLDPATTGAGDRLVDEGIAVSDADRAAVARIGALATEWGHTISQLSLAYLSSLPGIGVIIPSSSTVAQAEVNAAAGRITLTDEQRSALAEVFGR